MPEIYCSACKKTTAHKVVMRRCQVEQSDTFSSRLHSFTQLMTKFVSGDHYYHMEPQHFCRYCNTQNTATVKSLSPQMVQPTIG
ncbi:hypothetical protein FWP56_07045 [Vibrio vulnificus]|uniref:hypothetical protein n=1 Tax=Vibrio vulnificus TaxID=672 RepID=UPI0002E4C88D|nr:hypothetical protein [Vibrio vulnificus]EGQ8021233.1 hypothetical protein [Vibrio vulnificus]EGQ9277708.1 hypothetical protein [Vibrio vulnificus]EGQ9973358.1 hypothetical protein [Vibrio vulnificus]EHH3078850.1 hypothetical protein [Vibrio vulnificus]EHK8999021.1 hypothetical protein [Vibrio vulnificus]